MIRALNIGLVASAAFFIGLTPTVGGSFTLEQWTLSTRVQDFSSGKSDVNISDVVQNPFQLTQSVAINNGLTTATTTYDFSWHDTFGTFLIQAAHEAEDIDFSTLFSRSTGGFVIAASQDLQIAIDAEYTFLAPAPLFHVRLSMDVIDLADNSALFFGLEEGGPAFLGPPAGTLSIQDTVLVPAGSTYILGYEMLLQTFASGTDVIATADGNIAITLQTVPEPATLSLLIFGSLVLLRRRRQFHLDQVTVHVEHIVGHGGAIGRINAERASQDAEVPGCRGNELWVIGDVARSAAAPAALHATVVDDCSANKL